MAKVIFTTLAGELHVAQTEHPTSLMELALAEGLEGIDAECGGACACATCHVQIDAKWLERVGTAQDAELDMLDFCETLTDASRLSCQIEVTEALDGLEVTIVGR
jgi:2Fe-2S ferredoxin